MINFKGAEIQAAFFAKPVSFVNLFSNQYCTICAKHVNTKSDNLKINVFFFFRVRFHIVTSFLSHGKCLQSIQLSV